MSTRTNQVRHPAPAVFLSDTIRFLFAPELRKRRTEADHGIEKRRTLNPAHESCVEPSAKAPNQEPEYISSSESEQNLSPEAHTAIEPNHSTGPYKLLHEYGIVVCTECRIGIEPTEIASHLRETHERSPREARQIANRVQKWPLKRTIYEIMWPKKPVPAIRMLGEPEYAFRCDLPDCTYICHNLNHMKMHWEKGHKYKVWRRPKGVMFPMRGEFIRPWGPFKQIKVQIVFRIKGIKYFEVYELDKEAEEVSDALMRLIAEDMAPEYIPPVGVRSKYNYELMCDVLREHLRRWSLECPICVLAGRDWCHRPTTVDCPLVRSEDIEGVELIYEDRWLVRVDTSCRFCRMPGTGCLSMVSGKQCDENSWRCVLQVFAGLLRAGGRFFRSILKVSILTLRGWYIRPWCMVATYTKLRW